MTNEDIAAAIQNGSTELYGELWERVYKLIAWHINRFYAANEESCISSGATREDLLQSGYIALVNAVNDFKPDSGYSLSTYLTLHIKNQCREMTGRRTKKRDALNYAASLDEPLPNSDDMVLSDTVADPADDIEDETERIYRGELRAAVNSGVSALPEEYRAVITERFYNGCTYREIGENGGYSLDKARDMETEGLRRLRANRELKAFYADTYAEAIRSTGLSSFRTMQASSVELTAEKMERLKEQNHRG